MVSGIINKQKEGAQPLARIAASFYLNSAPLIWSFTEGSQREEVELLTDAAPARCADMLARGAADAALVPVIEYQRIPEILAVPHVCVGSRSRVRSVVLATRERELKDVRTVSLDTSSRTSVALTRILFREFEGFEPEWKTAEPDLQSMLQTSDAALMIGDPAMVFPREGLRVYDLAGLWRERTGLGFVFAIWMARASAVEKVRGVDFEHARDEGLRHVEDIVTLYEKPLQLPREELRSYLLDNISFELDEEMRAGLALFYQLAHKQAIIPDVQPLKWLHQ